jgi:hypothetical protein
MVHYTNLQTSVEGCGSERAVLPMMMKKGQFVSFLIVVLLKVM